MNIEVLVPTYNQSKEDILNLVKKLNVKSDALFANQNGKNETYDFDYDGHKIRIVCTDTKGVSLNRNILLNNCSGDICICIDDDCPLIEKYVSFVNDFYKKHDISYAVFNGILAKQNNKKVYSGKTKKVKRYCNLSTAGGPGFTFDRIKLLKLGLKYNEKVGVPNYICAGEDSLFYRDLFKTKALGYRVSDVLFIISNEATDSSYYKGINEQYVTTRGYITYLLHPYLFILYKIRHVLRFKKLGTDLSLHEMNKCMNKGKKMTKESK